MSVGLSKAIYKKNGHVVERTISLYCLVNRLSRSNKCTILLGLRGKCLIELATYFQTVYNSVLIKRHDFVIILPSLEHL